MQLRDLCSDRVLQQLQPKFICIWQAWQAASNNQYDYSYHHKHRNSLDVTECEPLTLVDGAPEALPEITEGPVTKGG